MSTFPSWVDDGWVSPAFAQHPSTTVLFAVTVLAWVTTEARQSRQQRAGAQRRDRGSRQVLRLTVAAGWVLAAGSVYWWPSTRLPTGVAWVGLITAWTGLAVRVWAFRALGGLFTFQVTTSPDQAVVSDGPYRYVRHPGYLGLHLVLLGLALTYGSWVGGLATLILPLSALTYRIHVEELALREALGDRYTSYATSRRRLLPGVW